MQRFVRYLVLVCSFVVILPSVAALADSYGPPYQVNATASANLIALDAAVGSNGDALVLWQSGAQGTGNSYLQRRDTAGRTLVAQEWSAGTGGTKVVAGPSGTFAVLRVLPENGAYSLFATIYSRAGGVIVPQLRVNDFGSPVALFGGVGIAFNPSGQFVVAWTGTKQIATLGNLGYYVYAKRFSAGGVATTSQVLVHASSADSHRIGSVDTAMDTAGNFIVSWDFGDFFAVDFESVFLRRFNASGLPVTATVRVNTTTHGDHSGNQVAMDDAGDFVIVWNGTLPSGTGDAVFGQRFNAAGAPLGGELQVNTTATQLIEGTDVAMAPDGSFVVTWQDSTVTFFGQIMARAYSSAGAPLGSAFQVSSATDAYPTTARIAMDRAGNYTIAWLQHHFTNDQFNKVYARRYATTGVTLQPIANGQIVTQLAGAAGSWQYFKITVPSGQATVEINISGGTGDADLYTRWGALPTLTEWDGRPFVDGNTEGARMLNFPAGDWYIGINGFLPYAGLSLQATSH